MFILTDGKNYVMENPMQQGVYLNTTSPNQAKEFTFNRQGHCYRTRKNQWDG